MDTNESFVALFGHLFRAHPWHGISIGPEAPDIVTSYIELAPSDTVKYELDKETGVLRLDRPQLYSNVCPTIYGFVPQTYCGIEIAAYCMERTGLSDIVGDGDPLDICVLTEKDITHGNILVEAIPIGGLRMIDGNEADDKIIAVLKRDVTYGDFRDISQCSRALIERLKHYFLTYKQAPDDKRVLTQITHVYGRDEALEVIRRSQQDYATLFPDLRGKLDRALDL